MKTYRVVMEFVISGGWPPQCRNERKWITTSSIQAVWDAIKYKNYVRAKVSIVLDNDDERLLYKVKNKRWTATSKH